MDPFFVQSEFLCHDVLRPLSHFEPNWDLYWDHDAGEYEVEENSYASQLNRLIDELSKVNPPLKYHDNEDFLANYVRISLKWPVIKEGGRWICDDYSSLLEQGGFGDINEQNLLNAASGRIHTALKFGQKHFDDMEEGHRKILASVLSIVLYHRSRY